MAISTAPETAEDEAQPRFSMARSLGAPNSYLAELLYKSAIFVSPEEVIANRDLRNQQINLAFEIWENAQTKIEAIRAFSVLAILNTIEANSPDRSDADLDVNVCRFLDANRGLQPTLIHVTPIVVEAINNEDYAAEYLRRMLAKPTQDGWMPVNDQERQLRQEWAGRFKNQPVFDTIVRQDGLMQNK